MPRTTRATQQIVRAGLAASYTAADAVNGEAIPNSGAMALHIKNTGAGACTVTIDTPGTVDGLLVAQLINTIPATTGDRFIGPFPSGQYGQSDGTVWVDYSTAVGVTVAALNLG